MFKPQLLFILLGLGLSNSGFAEDAKDTAANGKVSVFIKKGSVYLKENGKARRIALGTDDGMSMEQKKFKIGDTVLDGHFNLRMYQKVAFSPNERFVFLEAQSWETRTLDVYDRKKDRLHIADTDLPSAAQSKVKWLPDNRLQLVGGCMVDEGCKLLESENAITPWQLKMVKKIGE